MQISKVFFPRTVFDSLLSYSMMNHPREGILLMRGRKKGNTIEVMSIVIPPNAVHAHNFSMFGWHLLPVDRSYVGVAHSHPSGIAEPSEQDVFSQGGRIMVIVGYPYADESCVGVFDSNGRRLEFEVASA